MTFLVNQKLQAINANLSCQDFSSRTVSGRGSVVFDVLTEMTLHLNFDLKLITSHFALS